MRIIRSPRPADRYAQISNKLLQDNRLKLRARGLAALLLSYPPKWETSPQRLAKVMPDGEKAIYSAMTELEAAGYMVRWQERHNDGRLGEVVRFIFDDPRDAADALKNLEAAKETEPAEDSPVTQNRQAVPTGENTASSQVRPVAGLRHAAKRHAAEEGPIKTYLSNTDLSNTEKDGGNSSSSSSPSVTRNESTTTPNAKLNRVGLTSNRDQNRFKTYLRETKNAKSAEAVVMAIPLDDLKSQVTTWRASIDPAFDDESPQPVICDHDQEISLGPHMCPSCDPERATKKATTPHHDSTTQPTDEPIAEGASMPQWVREALIKKVGQR